MFALGGVPPVSSMLTGFAALFFISASILIMNDYFDIESDKINAPDRPLPSQQVTPNEVLILSIIIALIGLAVSYLIGNAALMIAILLLIIGFLYNRKYKKTGFAGNLMVSFSVGSTFIFGGISVAVPYHELVWLFAVIAALINLGEEIAADAMDMEGDKKTDSKSIAIRFGVRTAINVSSVIFIAVVILSFLPFVLSWLSVLYLVPILIMDTVIVFSVCGLRRRGSVKGRKYIRTIYLGALFGMLILLIMNSLGL
jgi:geranylgeranylglycerol-phosphate geranylgeranyltransferase